MNYFKNLMIALLGDDPYRKELDRVKGEYEKTAARVRDLEDTFFEVEQKKAETEETLSDFANKLSDAEALLKEKDKQIVKKISDLSSLQAVIENLRQHNKDKDEQMAQMNREFEGQVESYKKRIASYSEQIARLQAQLDKARKRNKTAKTKKEPTKQEQKKS